jgi:hypothetical protein
VAGLICNGVPYIYDSNNVVAQTNWPQGDMDGYTAELRRVESEYAEFDKFVEAAVYVDTGALSSGKIGGIRAMRSMQRPRRTIAIAEGGGGCRARAARRRL